MLAKHQRLIKQGGFGLIEAMITLIIVIFVFISFVLVMLKSMSAAGHANKQADMSIELDNRVQSAWITGSIDTTSNNGVNYSINGTMLRATDTRLAINQERVASVQVQ
ncbi:type IV pilus modification PilV family protein [Facilibium subflavum]|uniref:type IV pilus modification PilV family protein n=1 Tax=Facilibium subflavum TaxID=2219058 RepID=UPI000E65482A|nr:hypothetical protein [Facilibium subflavum]